MLIGMCTKQRVACMQEAGFPDINIICEKVAAEGETRFEDRYRLPIGISVNMTSFSAKLLTSAIYNPRNIMVFSQVSPLGGLSVPFELDTITLTVAAVHAIAAMLNRFQC